mmetsp:Transcript_7242/g.30058  ORF Transcript_7242/g.30058 Transcript_7242/m.30058 type:complete len:174 (-) Transcript_7242:580-1101(-)
MRWRPFFLAPDAPTAGVVKREYYAAKFGAARTAQMEPFLKQTFAEVGMDFSMGGLTGNTMDSHRLIAYAETFGPEKQNALVAELFQNYFAEEKFIGDPAVLVAAATKVGLPNAETVVHDKTAYRNEVLAQYEAKARGVSGVPFFILGDGKMTLSGAQPVETFVDALTRVARAS